MNSTTQTDTPLKIDESQARRWKGIVWHHSASPDKPMLNDWDGVVKYHTSHRIDFNIVSKEEWERRIKSKEGKVFQSPWKAVGYHGGVELFNSIPTFHWGRPLSMIGAHSGVSGVSSKFNMDYLGICCLGNFDVAEPDEVVWKFCLSVTRAFTTKFHIPKEEVIGHREVFDRIGVPRQKTCPGLKWDMNKFRGEL